MKRRLLLFLPLLVLYLALVVRFSSETMVSDESGYVAIAERMIHGAAGPASGTSLWWGPGYPIILLPFAWAGTPWLCATLLNAFFLLGALLYFHAALERYLPARAAVVVTYLLGLYPPFMREVHLLMTESLVFLLVCGLVFHARVLADGGRRARLHLGAVAFFLGYLALTKVIFGYVLGLGVLATAVLYAWRRRDPFFRRAFLVTALGMLLCTPYLAYTYSLTGRPFYWGSSGGLSLYWMSSTRPGELGSWFSPAQVQETPELAGHREFFAQLAPLSKPEMDLALRQQALRNIRQDPRGYARNWVANVGRLLFSYPFSFGRHSLSTYFYLLPNMFLAVVFAFSLYPGFRRWRAIPPELRAILLLGVAWFGADTLVSAFDRQFRPLVPVLLAWVSYVYLRIVLIEFRGEAPR
jgi:hypothetical protein